MFLYSFDRRLAAAAATFLVGLCLFLRTYIVNNYVGGFSEWGHFAYQPFYTRLDAYMLGMLLYMCYDNVIKPIKTRSYYGVLEPRRNQRVADEESRGGQEEAGSNTPANSSFGKLMYDYTVEPVIKYFQVKHEEFWFFHSNAPVSLIISAWCSWAVAIAFVVVGARDVFTSHTDYWSDWFDQDIEKYQSLSYSIFVQAGLAVSLLFIAVEGTIFPVAWIFNQYFWYFIGNITYTSYLLSILTAYYIAVRYKEDYNGLVLLIYVSSL